MTKARDLANAATALSAVTATELGYLDGVTSSLQTQMDAKASTSYVASQISAIDLQSATVEDVMDSF